MQSWLCQARSAWRGECRPIDHFVLAVCLRFRRRILVMEDHHPKLCGGKPWQQAPAPPETCADLTGGTFGSSRRPTSGRGSAGRRRQLRLSSQAWCDP